jgi:hypothetical protein
MVPVSEEFPMRTHTNPNPRLMSFISLREVSKALGARSRKELLKDLRSLTPQERRDVADLVKQEGSR